MKRENIQRLGMTLHQYQYLHQWVASELGKDSLCENCGSTESKYYDWANISGEYRKDLSDWARLCRQCHHLFDNFGYKVSGDKHYRWSGDYCSKGHQRTEENTYWRYKKTYTENTISLTKMRVCRPCKRAYARKYKEE